MAIAIIDFIIELVAKVTITIAKSRIVRVAVIELTVVMAN